jgi:hypothetical protein
MPGIGDDEADHLRADVQLERRRSEVAARWDLADEIVLVGAGHPVAVPGRGDRAYPFRAHSEYYYLTDRERPGGVLAFDPGDGWVDFVAPVTRDERLWEGASEDPGGVDVSQLSSWLEKRAGRPLACLGAPVAGVSSDEPLATRLRRGLNDVRRPKDEIGRAHV